MLKVLVVFGTRPEAIKMVPVILELKKYPKQIDVCVCVTGQHRDMLDQVLNLFQVIPDYDLEIMRKQQDLFEIFTNSMLGMREVLKESSPDIVLVHGDTSSSTAAALSAFYFKIPVGHVEAGLRTRQIYNPWPEEMNRQLNTRIASFHFAPTLNSKKNLLSESVPEQSIFVTGNTVIDALHLVSDRIDHYISNKPEKIFGYFPSIPGQTIHSWVCGDRKMILITGHRRENFGDGFYSIFLAIKELVETYPEVDFVFPIHLNPNVRLAVKQVFGENSSLKKNLFFTEPLEYLPFIFLIKSSYLVLTDSGGIQEEAPGLGKPVLVFRETTERIEALEAGTVVLVGADPNKIKSYTEKMLLDHDYYKAMSNKTNPYGDGNASRMIVNEILKQLS